MVRNSGIAQALMISKNREPCPRTTRSIKTGPYYYLLPLMFKFDP
jgi:hypothetical protein